MALQVNIQNSISVTQRRTMLHQDIHVHCRQVLSTTDFVYHTEIFITPSNSGCVVAKFSASRACEKSHSKVSSLIFEDSQISSQHSVG